jgi:multidrug efflux pump subunit AcrA (membrane-fusion protein)
MKNKLENLGVKSILFLLGAVLILGLGAGYGLSRISSSGTPGDSHSADAMGDSVQPAHAATPKDVLFDEREDGKGPDAGATSELATQYVCPMMCVSPMEKAGSCPVCGMDLVPMAVSGHAHDDGAPKIELSPAAVQAAGIQVAPVEEKFVEAEIRLFGKIEYDPVEQYKVTAFAPGVIDNIYVRRAGQAVRKGDPLFDLHTSELYYLEHELFETLAKLPYKLDIRPGKGHGRKRVGRWTRLLLERKPEGAPEMSVEEKRVFNKEMDTIRRKMRLLGVTDNDIDGMIVRGQPSGISTVTTPMTGVVLEQNAFRGSYINTGDVVFTIANPRVLWAKLDAYASDFPWIKLGQKAVFETDAYPGVTFEGKVLYIDPEFNSETRTFKIGVLYTDSKGLLKPNMLVRCAIRAQMTAGGRSAVELLTQGMMGTAQAKRSDKPPLVIPDTAPLITGKRAIVYVADSENSGVYEGREVILGPRAKGYYLVYAGLEKGEQVVVNGNFKIDSAIQIMAKPSMMEIRGNAPPAMHHQSAGAAKVAAASPGNTQPGYKHKTGGVRRMNSADLKKMQMKMTDHPKPAQSAHQGDAPRKGPQYSDYHSDHGSN